MAKKYFQRALSVGLSLALCAGLVMPSFAAQDITQAYIDGLAQSSSDNRIVLESDDGVFNMTENVTTEHTLTFGSAKGVEFNMNGHTLKKTGETGSAIDASGVNLTVNGAGESGNMGKIVGEKKTNPVTEASGVGGIYAEGESKLAVNGVEFSGLSEAIYYKSLGDNFERRGTVSLDHVVVKDNEQTGNRDGSGITIWGATEVEINDTKVTNNKNSNGVGSVWFEECGEVRIKNTEVANNTVTNENENCTHEYGWGTEGAGLEALKVKELKMQNVVVSGNTAKDSSGMAMGGGMYLGEIDEVKMKDVTVAKNEANGGGGMYVWDVEKMEMDGVSVIENTADYGCGMQIINDGYHYAGANKWEEGGSTVINAANTVITNNTAKGQNRSCGDDIYIYALGSTTLAGFEVPGGTLKEDQKPITGWYYDYSGTDQGWGGSGDFPYYKYENINGPWEGSACLKAAHDQYFKVTYMDGVGGDGIGAAIEGATGEAEKGSAIPVPPAPTRNGYRLTGWKLADGSNFDPNGKVTGDMTVVAQWEVVSNPPQPPVGGGGGTTIDEPAVPLAGLFTRADAIGYLWEQAGEPEAELSDFPDVPEDHEWAVAIGWAQDMGIALPDLDGNFRPDDLVLRSVESLEVSPEGELQEFLDRYAVYAGIELAEGEHFYELDGAWDDVIMGEEAQVIFDGFFAKLGAALAQAA